MRTPPVPVKLFIEYVLNILESNELLDSIFPPSTDGILKLCNPPQIDDSACSAGLTEVQIKVDTREYN